MLSWLKRNSGVLSGALLLCIALGAALLLQRGPGGDVRPMQISPPAPRLSTPAPSPSPARTPTPTRTLTPVPTILVQVEGAVERPGVYRLPKGSHLLDLVTAAGGFAPDADTTRLNRAQLLKDGDLITIGRLGTRAPAATGAPPAPAGKVDINSADAAELERLPGIGSYLAAQIIAYRQAHGPFARIEDLDKVSGIGPATVERLRNLVVAR